MVPASRSKSVDISCPPLRGGGGEFSITAGRDFCITDGGELVEPTGAKLEVFDVDLDRLPGDEDLAPGPGTRSVPFEGNPADPVAFQNAVDRRGRDVDIVVPLKKEADPKGPVLALPADLEDQRDAAGRSGKGVVARLARPIPETCQAGFPVPAGNSPCQCATFSLRFSDKMRHLLNMLGRFSIGGLRGRRGAPWGWERDSRPIGLAAEGLGTSRSDDEGGGGYHPIPPPGPIPAPRTTPPAGACPAAGSCRL